MIRPIPDDFVATQSELKTSAKLAKHYRASTRTVYKWMRALGIVLIDPHRLRPLPSDFPTMARLLTKSALAAHYKTTPQVIARWFTETDLTPKDPRATRNISQTWRPDIPGPRRETEHDLAAEYLRRFGPVSRCDERGRYRQAGDYYLVGNTVHTKDELLARARRNQDRAMRKMLQHA